MSSCFTNIYHQHQKVVCILSHSKIQWYHWLRKKMEAQLLNLKQSSRSVMKTSNSILIITNMFPTAARMAWRQESCNVNESINANLNIENSFHFSLSYESLYHKNEATGWMMCWKPGHVILGFLWTNNNNNCWSQKQSLCCLSEKWRLDCKQKVYIRKMVRPARMMCWRQGFGLLLALRWLLRRLRGKHNDD